MRVGLIAYGLDAPPRAASGIGRYGLELARALAALEYGPQITFLAAVRGHDLAQGGAEYAYMPGCRLLPGLVTLGNVLVPWAARRLSLDVVHDPTGVSPFLFRADGARTVVTVHDVFAWSCPGHSTLPDTLIYRYWLPRILPIVDAVITVSKASKKDIIAYLKVPPDKVHVTYEGVDVAFYPISAEQVAQTTPRYDLPRGYILFVGSVEERKNLRRLLCACDLLWRQGERRQLVIVGARKWQYSGIMQTVKQLGIERHVVFTGFVPDSDLPALYSGADLFVFPSLYEGFGFPVLEAMACGTPVVCSNTSSLPEVVGDAAIMVDPSGVQGLAEAIHRVLTDDGLRRDLRAKGLARARQFTWERTALETVAIYRQVLERANTR